MSVYRRKYRVIRNGKVIEGTSRFYTVEFTGPDGKLVRRSTKCTNRRAADAAELAMRQTVEGQHTSLVDVTESRKPIDDHIDEFIAYLLTQLKRNAQYCRVANGRLKLLAKECAWLRIGDVSLGSFEAWRKAQATARRSGRTPKAKTINHFLDTARRFLNWAMRRGKVKNNPLANAEKARVIDNRDYRRAGTPEEFGKLLAAVGKDRQRFYRWAVFVPLRRGSHAALVWGDIHESDKRPWVGIRGETIKDRKYIPLPLRKDVAEMMAEWRKEVNPKDADLVFASIPRAVAIARDMAKAGVEFKNAKGLKRLDLHAFRRTALKWMKQAGVPLEDAAAILQHKDIHTTRRYYDEEPDAMSTEVVEKMPRLPEPKPKPKKRRQK